MLIVLTTTPNLAEAESLAQKIVEAKLAACVQVLPQLTSFYFWENSIQKDSEYILLIKTLSEKYSELEKFIQANHSYKVPEIVAIEAEKVSEPYQTWMNNFFEKLNLQRQKPARKQRRITYTNAPLLTRRLLRFEYIRHFV